MAAQSPLPAYIMGTAMVGLGLFGLNFPVRAYEFFGLPLSPVTAAKAAEKTHPAAQTADRSPSPFLYAKAARDLGIGLTFIALQAQGYDDAVTTFGGVCLVVGLLDGWIVWQHGGELQSKAWGHWLPSVAFAGLFAWRAGFF